MVSSPHSVAFGFVEQLAQDLKDERLELPAFPEAVVRIQHALQAPDTDVGDVAEILGSDPALAARILRTANSAAFRRSDHEITDLRGAVARMGYNMVRTIAVAFAMRQLRRKDAYSVAAQAEIERIWHDSLNVAAICRVLARHYTRLNADQALLAGLLHALGRLYIVMRAEEAGAGGFDPGGDLREVTTGWHAAIGKAILDSWGLPEAMQLAVEQQDDWAAEREGDVSLTDVLVAARVLAATEHGEAPDGSAPALVRLCDADGRDPGAALAVHADEIAALRGTFSD